MAASTIYTSPRHTEDDECSSESNWSNSSSSVSQPDMIASSSSTSQPDIIDFDAIKHAEVSLVTEESFSAGNAGSASFDDCTLDSIGDILIKLEGNDASITELIVDCETLGFEAATYLEQLLPRNNHVERLFLRCGKSSEHQEICYKILSGLRRNPSIVSLAIQGAAVDGEMASRLLPFFAHSRRLKHLSMISCKGPGLEGLFLAMENNKYAQRLTFQSCHWETYLSDIVVSSLPLMNIHSLSLIDINIPANGGWPFLFERIVDCKELKHLDLSRNRLGASSIYLLTKSLIIQRQISKLSLSYCSLDDECMKELAIGLQCFYTLTSLDISYNGQIKDEGVKYLRELLYFNYSITALKVNECGFSVQSMDGIERGIRYNNSYLRYIFSYALFGCVDSIVDPQVGRSKRNDAEPAHDEERGYPDDQVSQVNENFSIKTEQNSMQTRPSVRSRKGRLCTK